MLIDLTVKFSVGEHFGVGLILQLRDGTKALVSLHCSALPSKGFTKSTGAVTWLLAAVQATRLLAFHLGEVDGNLLSTITLKSFA